MSLFFSSSSSFALCDSFPHHREHHYDISDDEIQNNRTMDILRIQGACGVTLRKSQQDVKRKASETYYREGKGPPFEMSVTHGSFGRFSWR